MLRAPMRASAGSARVLAGLQSLTGVRWQSGGGGTPSRVYGRYTIFKGKAALDIGPIAPTFKAAGVDAAAVDRPGVLLLGFTPSEGERSYAWGNKQLFSLSAVECGELLSKVTPALGANSKVSFYHDPAMGQAAEGQNSKRLEVSTQAGDDGDHVFFFSLSTSQSDQRLTVPVTMAEFAVVRVLLQYAIPHMLGWDVMLNPSLISFDSIASQQLEAQQHFTSQPGAGAGAAAGAGAGFAPQGMGGGGGGGIPSGSQEGPGAAGGDWPF